MSSFPVEFPVQKPLSKWASVAQACSGSPFCAQQFQSPSPCYIAFGEKHLLLTMLKGM